MFFMPAFESHPFLTLPVCACAELPGNTLLCTFCILLQLVEVSLLQLQFIEKFKFKVTGELPGNSISVSIHFGMENEFIIKHTFLIKITMSCQNLCIRSLQKRNVDHIKCDSVCIRPNSIFNY
ncbi:hypothetical protein KIL84_007368 [Mauremys mutica]|uniref:Uncharacterized protein n=1 Tax=Mauremys mutica TaxID=74926 RepID=A0A9D4AX10_9SAUR|nr:hypothetical protein KIL84_007368 [Mauremys mutica]